MGRAKQVNPPPAGTSRREFFKRSSAAAGALAAAPLLPLAAAAMGRESLFLHGVASGDPLADRVILWTRVSVPASATAVVEYVIATDPKLRRVVGRGRTRTDASRDHTVKVDVDGLRPDTTYYYRFRVVRLIERPRHDRRAHDDDRDDDGDDRGFDDERPEPRLRRSPIGRTKTLPRGNAQRLRAAVVSCSSLAHGYFNAYRRIAERADLDLVIHLGDYIYEYGSGQYGTVRDYEPATEILTLTDYRTRHAQYKRDADLQELHRQHPTVIIWDDHEVANDAYVTGAQNHTEGAEGTWPGRVAMALQAYYEWMPVRVVDPADLRNNSRHFEYGKLVDLIMLEERLSARSQQLPSNIGNPSGYFVQGGAYADPQRELLGPSQQSWLFGKLRQSKAKWKLIGQGVMFAQLKVSPAANAAGGGVFLNSDQWDGYQPARDRVYSVLKGALPQTQAVGNVVVLTGDIHSSWAADLTQDPNNPVAAAGGYNPVTGEGSVAVEFVGTSVTSPAVDDPNGAVAAGLRAINPHFKYIDLTRRGYMLLDVTAQRALCEWWYVDTVASVSNVQTFGAAFEVQDGSNHLVPAAQTTPRTDPPALAP